MRAESDSYRLVGYVSFCYLCKAGNVIILVCHCVCMSVCLSVCLYTFVTTITHGVVDGYSQNYGKSWKQLIRISMYLGPDSDQGTFTDTK